MDTQLIPQDWLERHFRDAVNVMKDGFGLFDAEDRVVLHNDSFIDRGTALAIGNPIGRTFEEIVRAFVEHDMPEARSPDFDREAWIAWRMELHRNPPCEPIEVRWSDRWVRISERRTADGGYVGIWSDITALKQREKDLAMANERLGKQAQSLLAMTAELSNARRAAKAANISKSQFLANMSHELRTPLNAILGFAEVIAKDILGPQGSANYRTYAADIFRSGSHLLSLINDLLDLSKIEADHMTLDIERLDTAAIVAETVHLVEGLAAERGIEIDAIDIAGCPALHGDARQIKQVLLNLLSNAVKFTPDGGRVTLSARDSGEEAILRIDDTGIGMTAAELRKAMERFGQAEPSYSRSTPGTGLGLPLADGIVKLHGGSLTIDSSKGQGTSVIVRLPWRAELR